MDHVFENIVDILVAVIIMFIFPLLYFGQKLDTITQKVVYADTSKLVDTVQTQGYLTKEMYENYLKSIGKAKVIGNIELVHKELLFEPEYRFKTTDEVITEQNTKWSGINVYTYIPVSTNIPNIIDPNDSSELTMNSETNESILASAINTPASPSHVHSDACYTGHRHLDGVGIKESSYQHGCYTTAVTGSITYCDKIVYSCMVPNGFPAIASFNNYCPLCHLPCTVTSNQYYYKCSSNHLHVTSGDQYFTCSYCGKSGLYADLYTPDLNGSICNASIGSNTSYQCDLTEDLIPDCSTIISSISTTHPTQTIYLNDPLISTVTVTYKDGSTKTVAATANFTPNTIVQNKIVTLSYGGFTKNITVTVIPKTKTCINGHTYNLDTDGSDPGCIYCDSWVSKIEVMIPSTKEISIYKGTTLEENGVAILATYMNGRTETLYSSYVDNLDLNYVGIQTVTIGYKGKTTFIKVTTKRNLMQCSICGKYYELYPDESDPGCPFCASEIPVYTGTVMKYYKEIYTEEIVKELYEGSGIYYFKEGDYFHISISNKAKSLGIKLISTFIPNVPRISIKVDYGGVIRDDARIE